MSGSILWIDPSFGASGDMFLGALSGLIGNTDSLVEGLASLKLDGYSISSETVTQGRDRSQPGTRRH